MDPRLQRYRDAWSARPTLRAVYGDYHRRLLGACVPGRTLEIGGGGGGLKEAAPAVVATDILPAPWLDLVADAHALPFAAASFANIVMIDVLHHLARPRRFLAEVERVLSPGGRLILLEPAATPVSRLVYALAHDEPIDLAADPLALTDPPPPRDPYVGNQAIATLLFVRQRARLEALFPALELRELAYTSLFAYPLSGGYRSPCLLPAGWVAPLLRLEDRLAPSLGWLLAFRLFVVVARR